MKEMQLGWLGWVGYPKRDSMWIQLMVPVGSSTEIVPFCGCCWFVK